MTDRLIAFCALLGVIAFFAPILWRVNAPDLMLVIAVVIVMMIYDFWRDLRAKR